MFREGGWAVPLSCNSPTLQSWLTHLRRGCSILGVPCDTYIDTDLGICPDKWSPLAIAVTTTAVAVILLLFLAVSFKHLLRWAISRRGPSHCAVATAAVAELHKANPELYPPAPHCWYRLAEDQMHAPLLCAVCQDRIQPDADAKKVQCCEVCGVVSHEGCVRKVPHDCRPAAEAGDRMLHLWKPAGVVMYDEEEEVGEVSLQTCLYCQNHCEGDLFAQEPTWSCAWCRATAHVRCYHSFHAHALETAAPLSRRSSKDKGEGGRLGRQTPPLMLPDFHLNGKKTRTTKKGGKKHRRNRSLQNLPSENSLPAPGITKSASGSKLGLGSLIRATSDNLTGLGRKRSSIGSFLSSLAVAVGGAGVEDDDGSDERSTAGPRQPGDVDLEFLDTCTFGPHRRLVLSPTAVRLIPGSSWADRAKSFLRGAASKDKKGGKQPKSLESEGKGGTQRVASWWGEPHIPWSSYRIEGVPPSCKPLLVFLNTKSGPQIGSKIRRRLLRLLNPIQIVELPKEKPEEPLELFADVPNLQLLVMGGDGTAGWILSCLDAMQEARAQLPEPKVWSPPPVAVIPLGTGNDLARCLKWGSSFQGVRQKGLANLLHQVEHDAIVSLLDRWCVAIDASPPPASPRSTLRRMGSLGGREPDPPKGVKKAMNNYLGIGVDAKAALDFHALRDSYPTWFCSQMGNKLWYTGFGAKDIVEHTSRGLSRKLEVECDGKPLELPDDIEGLLLLNINSYMGGVDLWASGVWPPGRRVPAKQSICDGKLELVAVYGSWHLGQLQVGLSKAIRLTQCSTIRITTSHELPMQLDGEPWMQPPACLQVDLKMKAFMLRRVESEPVSRVANIVQETLDDMVAKKVIDQSQRVAITSEIAARLYPVL